MAQSTPIRAPKPAPRPPAPKIIPVQGRKRPNPKPVVFTDFASI